ncbi:DnaA regulatory inactivator Hda (Homologous to DnaA) [hydrothermal vent metagenome]|uniref:DnaA regulatory inactivator Hda (Homologous to DnaA) n=1 Tax=hydrothermal vent metagenome TaxID=652676 RepID=A0A1W1DBX2_9ZZZZ
MKDLKTRLSLATIFCLETLDDQNKKSIIQQQMDERNLKIDHKIYDYLFKHYSRDLSDLLNAINQLDKASLQQKNNITIPLVKQVLGI